MLADGGRSTHACAIQVECSGTGGILWNGMGGSRLTIGGSDGTSPRAAVHLRAATFRSLTFERYAKNSQQQGEKPHAILSAGCRAGKGGGGGGGAYTGLITYAPHSPPLQPRPTMSSADSGFRKDIVLKLYHFARVRRHLTPGELRVPPHRPIPATPAHTQVDTSLPTTYK